MGATTLPAHNSSRNVRAKAKPAQPRHAAARHKPDNWLHPRQSARRNCGRRWGGRHNWFDCQASVFRESVFRVKLTNVFSSLGLDRHMSTVLGGRSRASKRRRHGGNRCGSPRTTCRGQKADLPDRRRALLPSPEFLPSCVAWSGHHYRGTE